MDLQLCVGDFAIFEDGAIEFGCFFGLAGEPEAGGDLNRHCLRWTYDDDLSGLIEDCQVVLYLFRF